MNLRAPLIAAIAVVVIGQGSMDLRANASDADTVQIKVTGLDKKSFHIDTTKIVRLRASLRDEGFGGRTRIDWIHASFALEGPESVAALVKPKLASLVQAKQPNGAPLWFNVKMAVGPFRVYSHEQREGVKTVVVLQNKRLLLGNTHEELAAAIRAGGGAPLSDPDGLDLFQRFRSLRMSILPAWD